MTGPRKILNPLLQALSGILPIEILKRITGKKTLFPFYHLISDRPVPHVQYLYPVRSAAEFTADLDFILNHFRPLAVSDILQSIRSGASLPENGFVLTFDDGLREFYDVAAPILLKKGIPAVCFLNTAFIDNRDLFYRYKASLLIGLFRKKNPSVFHQQRVGTWFREHALPLHPESGGLFRINYANRHLLDELAVLLEFDFNEYLQTARPYLDTSQIRSLAGQGFTFGAHSVDHPEYRFLTPEEQLRQTRDSLALLHENFGIREKLFSFPFTDFGVTRSFFETVFDPGDPVADLTFGGAGLKNDSEKRNLQRIPMEGNRLDAKRILGTEYIYYMIKAIFGKNLIRR